MNELLLVAQAAVSTALVLLTWRFAREKLYWLSFFFLIVISISSEKLVPFFGHITSTGNVFYAAIYLATYFLIERMGKRQGIFSIWLAVIAVAFFFACMQIVVAFTSVPATSDFNDALAMLFAPYSRFATARILAFVVSQNLNVYIYIYLRERWNGKYLWLRANISNAIAQTIDSMIFFTIAFWGMVPSSNITDIMVTGLSIKLAYMAITAPFLYLNRIEREDGGEYSTVSLR